MNCLEELVKTYTPFKQYKHKLDAIKRACGFYDGQPNHVRPQAGLCGRLVCNSFSTRSIHTSRHTYSSTYQLGTSLIQHLINSVPHPLATSSVQHLIASSPRELANASTYQHTNPPTQNLITTSTYILLNLSTGQLVNSKP